MPNVEHHDNVAEYNLQTSWSELEPLLGNSVQNYAHLNKPKESRYASEVPWDPQEQIHREKSQASRMELMKQIKLQLVPVHHRTSHMYLSIDTQP